MKTLHICLEWYDESVLHQKRYKYAYFSSVDLRQRSCTVLVAGDAVVWVLPSVCMVGARFVATVGRLLRLVFTIVARVGPTDADGSGIRLIVTLVYCKLLLLVLDGVLNCWDVFPAVIIIVNLDLAFCVVSRRVTAALLAGGCRCILLV